ncbi:restriction endonuclease subunit S [Acinetobacter bereziniae]|uniref:restriction endonuclease subunit S n=1 Tax=Acinetobacter bereziniae TaxID=106648 RepID=UPI003AF8BBE6
MSVPKLRFKEFDRDWQEVDIQTLVDERIIDKPMDGNHGEIHPTSKDYVEDGIPFVMATDVIDGIVHLDKSKKIKKSQADSLRKGFSLEGDILLTHKATIGNVAKVPELKTPYIMLTPQVTYYRVLNKNKLTSDFIKSSFESPIFQGELLALCTGATRLYIGISEQRKLPFSYPSKEEQTKIANFLSAVDEKINQLSQKHSLLSQYKQGMMQKLFSQQIRFKADDGSEFGEWEEKKIGEIFQVTSGSTPLRSDERFFKHSEIFWVKTTDLNNGLITTTEEKISKVALKETSIKVLPKGTVFVAMYGGFNQIGRTGLLTMESACNQALSAIYPNELVNSYFLLTYLNFKVEDWKNFAASSRKDPNITKSDVLAFPFILMSLEEQTKIANFLSAIDQKIEVVAQQIEQAKQWKKGLLQQMFV